MTTTTEEELVITDGPDPDTGNCARCRAATSRGATKCPHCGYNPRRKVLTTTLTQACLIVLWSVLIVAVIGQDGITIAGIHFPYSLAYAIYLFATATFFAGLWSAFTANPVDGPGSIIDTE